MKKYIGCNLMKKEKRKRKIGSQELNYENILREYIYLKILLMLIKYFLVLITLRIKMWQS
jgi:hypothetical protein